MRQRIAGQIDRHFFNPSALFSRVRRTSTQSISNNTWSALSFDTQECNSGGFHSTTVNAMRMTAGGTGVYCAGGFAAFATNGTGVRGSSLMINGTTFQGTCLYATNSGGNLFVSSQALLVLSAGDYVEFCVYQDSGGALNIGYTALTNCPSFWMARI